MMQVGLNLDLEDYVWDDPHGRVLHHPLLIFDGVSDQTVPLINEIFDEKSAAVFKAEEERDWHRYIHIHERPYRFEAFQDIEDRLSDEEYWRFLSLVYLDSENIWQNLDDWCRVLSSRRIGPHLFMTNDERKFFDSLPEKFTVYRGYNIGKNKFGLSYTLSLEKAQWFAKRYEPQYRGAVLKRIVEKAECFAYLERGNEKEIVIKPETLLSAKPIFYPI